MSYTPPKDPSHVLGAPDIVIRFVPREQDKMDRERSGRPGKAWLDKVAPSPDPGDKSPHALQARKHRKKLGNDLREKRPHVGGRLILKKRNTKIKKENAKRGHEGRSYAGKTELWRTFERWALSQFDRQLGRRDAPQHLRRLRLPLDVPHGAHVVWRYYAPDRSSWPDHYGVAETVGDLVQDAGILKDDVSVDSGDLSKRMPPDHEDPRLELWIRAIDEEGNTP